MTQLSFAESVLQTPPSGALVALQDLKDPSPLIDAWTNHGNAAAIQEVAERGSGPARKLARRALNVLKSRGVKAPAPQRKTNLVEIKLAEPIAWMLPPDGAGFLLLAVIRPASDGSCRASIVTLGETGVFRIENTETTLAKLEQSFAKALPGSGLSAVPVPVDWARHRIATARAAQRISGVPEPLGFINAVALLETALDTTPEHPFDAEGFEFSAEDATTLAVDSGALHYLPEFRTWLPSQVAVEQLLVAVGKQIPAGTSPETNEVSEYLKTAMLDATDSYFTASVRYAVAQRMRDSAISVMARDGESVALKLAATIQVVAGEEPKNARDIPFLCAFFEKAVSVLMAQSGGKLNIPLSRPASEPALSA
jgi:hypothetical protein